MSIHFFVRAFYEAWDLLLDSSVYMIFGLLLAGVLHIFLNPDSVAKHFGKGQFKSVLKAALLGIPIPL
jgi:uncharacterized membrane protein YraQ (UPF0718 family)